MAPVKKVTANPKRAILSDKAGESACFLGTRSFSFQIFWKGDRLFFF